MNLKEVQAEAIRNATEKGFHDEDESPPSAIRQIAWMGLLYSEVSEAIDCALADEYLLTFRGDGKPEGLLSELADIVIRVCDSAGALGIDLSETGHAITQHTFKGTGRRATLSHLGLITSDIGPALEAIRKGEPVDRYLRAIVARVEFVARALFPDSGDDPLNYAVGMKLAYNQKRPHKHGGKRA